MLPTHLHVYCVYTVSPSDIVSKWMGVNEKQVSDLFQKAHKKAPSIIFIEEIDSLRGRRGEIHENEPSRRTKSEFLVHMQIFCFPWKYI